MSAQAMCARGEGEGRGGGDEGGKSPGTFKSMSDVFSYMEKNNIDPTSQVGLKMQDDFDAKKSA